MGNTYDLYRLLSKPENLIEDLIEYINSFDVDWKDRLRGCSEKKIKKLIDVSSIEYNGYKLPESYINYLRYMGEDDGGLLGNLYAGYYSIDILIEDYPDWRSDKYGYVELENSQFAFFIGEMSNEPIYIMEFIDKTNYYISINGGKYIESFDKFLYRMALQQQNFLKSEGKILDFEYMMNFWINDNEDEKMINSIGENILKIIENIGNKYNYKRLWFSDKWAYLAQKEKGIMESKIDNKFFGRVRCNDINEIYNIKKELEELEEIRFIYKIYYK